MRATTLSRFGSSAALATGAMLLGMGAVATDLFWLQVPALFLLAAGVAGLAGRRVRPGLGFAAGCAAAAATLALSAWLLPEHRDWAWGVAALAALLSLRSTLPCGSCLGGSCATKPSGLEGFRFPPGH